MQRAISAIEMIKNHISLDKKYATKNKIEAKIFVRRIINLLELRLFFNLAVLSSVFISFNIICLIFLT